jgi:hypothetical protein
MSGAAWIDAPAQAAGHGRDTAAHRAAAPASAGTPLYTCSMIAPTVFANRNGRRPFSFDRSQTLHR